MKISTLNSLTNYSKKINPKRIFKLNKIVCVHSTLKSRLMEAFF